LELIQARDGEVLPEEKKFQNRLQISSSIEKIIKIDDHVINTYSGLISDSRALI
jgi:proteasome alpha subunit